MAGRRETPEDRTRRDEALTASAAEAEQEAEKVASEFYEEAGQQLTAMAGVATTPTDRAFVASAARIMLNDRRALGALRRTRQAWQSEAWDYIDEIGEVGFTLQFAANMISKVRLFAATKPDPKGDPVPVDDEAAEVDDAVAALAEATLERLKSRQGGQASLLRALDWNFETAGEAYLHGHEDPDDGGEEWYIRSVDEMVVQGDGFVLRTAMASTSVREVPKTDLVIRLWDPSPRFGELATSPMRRVLSVCENLLLLTRAMRADAMSHLNNGLLLKPEELSQGPKDPTKQESDGETDDPFEINIRETVIAPIEQPGSAASVAPTVVTGRAEYLKPDVFRHMTFSRPLDALLSQWIDGLVMRLARGLNMPVEVTTGLQETTFANAAVVKKSEWDAHGEPRMVLICEALTAGYYREALAEALAEANLDASAADDIFIWFDPAGAIAAPDPVDSADIGVEKGLIKAETWRRVKGYSDADAPSPDDILLAIAHEAPRMDPFMAGQLWRRTGIFPEVLIPMPVNGYIDADGNVVAAPAAPGEVAAAVMRELVAAGVVATARPRPPKRAAGRRLGRRLAAIDRHLQARLLTACEQALRRCMERAGAKVRSKVAGRGRDDAAARAAAAAPPREVCARLGREVVTAAGIGEADLLEGAFDDLVDDFSSWTEAAQAAALDELRGAVDLSRADAERVAAAQATARAVGADALKASMLALAARRLFDSSAGAAGRGEQASTVPAGVVRQAMGLAGGDAVEGDPFGTLTSAGGGPVGGVATGPTVVAETGGAERYVWDYGAAPRSVFEPHAALDGVEFDNFDDDVLANDEGWPDVPFFMPGDHDGCVCNVVPILSVPDGGDGSDEGDDE